MKTSPRPRTPCRYLPAFFNWTFVRQVGFVPWLLRYSRRQFQKRVLRRDSRLRLPTGSWIILPTQSASATEVYVTNANIDWGSEALFASFANTDRDFLDVGAHIGYYATYLSPCVRRVYAFEPDRRNVPALRKNASQTGDIEVIEAAVSSFDGTASFYAGSGSAVASLENIGGPSTQITVTTIDTFVASRPDLDVCLIKTDVEGHDLQALRGMHATVAGHQPLVLTECEYSRELSDLCDRWSYSIFAFTRDRNTLKVRFRKLLSYRDPLWTKMLFLVPQHLGNSFETLAAGRS
jgi:FkbM family methyltransferase